MKVTTQCPCCGEPITLHIEASVLSVEAVSPPVKEQPEPESIPVLTPAESGAVYSLALAMGFNDPMVKELAANLYGRGAKVLTSDDSPHPSKGVAVWTGRALRKSPKVEIVSEMVTDMRQPTSCYSGKNVEPDAHDSWLVVLGYV